MEMDLPKHATNSNATASLTSSGMYSKMHFCTTLIASFDIQSGTEMDFGLHPKGDLEGDSYVVRYEAVQKAIMQSAKEFVEAVKCGIVKELRIVRQQAAEAERMQVLQRLQMNKQICHLDLEHASALSDSQWTA